ncbi:MAG: DUF1003 domain-containing protein [Chloroflexi bacterium]|nr:DUF1003 domain-containing protein [Chloroflexota bacterium]
MAIRRYSSPFRQCQVCDQRLPPANLIPAALVRAAVVGTIRNRFPHWNSDGSICIACLTAFSFQHVEAIRQKEKGDLTNLYLQAQRGMRDHDRRTRDVNAEFIIQRTFGERVADGMAGFVGSWKFLGLFFVLMGAWIAANLMPRVIEPIDRYPFLFLTLLLSLMAAIQAPIIMMSQNRQEARDRLRAENEYRVNLKAELEVRLLTEKIDHLIKEQFQRLMEIQEIQLDMLEQLRPRPHRRRASINDVIGRSA